MVARIAPSPITTAVAVGDAPAHAADPNFPPPATHQHGNSPARFERRDTARANLPPPPALPGEAFAAAVIAGQLPPRPITPEQLRQRLGAAWQPPASPLRLMDRSA